MALLGAVLAAAAGPGHASWVDVGTFAVAAAIILSGAVGVVVARNPVHSALMLVMTLFGVAVLFVLQQDPFLAAVQVIVYAGAIVVLFLFVIMFLGVDREENIAAEPLRGQRPLAIGLIVLAHWPGYCSWARSPAGPPGPRTWPGSTDRPAVQRLPAGPVGVHHLPVPLRGHRGPAGHRRGGGGGPGPPPAGVGQPGSGGRRRDDRARRPTAGRPGDPAPVADPAPVGRTGRSADRPSAEPAVAADPVSSTEEARS